MFRARAHIIYLPPNWLTTLVFAESKRQSVMNNTRTREPEQYNVVERATADCSFSLTRRAALLVILSLTLIVLSLSPSSGALEQECSCNQIGALWPWLNAQRTQLCECARTERESLAICNPGDALCGFTKENADESQTSCRFRAELFLPRCERPIGCLHF